MARQRVNDEANDDLTGGMETRTRIYLESHDRNEPLVDKVEHTTIGMGGMTEFVDIQLRHIAGCNHIPHTGSEVGGICANPGCHAVLCTKCSGDKNNVCGSCGRIVCGSCQKKIWLRAKDTVMCPQCARRWWVKELSRAGFVAFVVFLLLVLIGLLKVR